VGAIADSLLFLGGRGGAALLPDFGGSSGGVEWFRLWDFGGKGGTFDVDFGGRGGGFETASVDSSVINFV